MRFARCLSWSPWTMMGNLRGPVLIVLGCHLIIMAILGFSPIHIVINDKMLHGISFGILGILLFFLFKTPFPKNALFATICTFAASISSEFIQGMLPYRTFDWYDIYANCIGAACGIVLSAATQGVVTLLEQYHNREQLVHNTDDIEAHQALLDTMPLEDMPPIPPR